MRAAAGGPPSSPSRKIIRRPNISRATPAIRPTRSPGTTPWPSASGRASARGYEIRLPTEFEWQLAATGGEPGRSYPWGGDWDPKAEPWRANTYESDLGGATAVGLYPHGASPVGSLDMAGTLWDWCLNAFEHPDDVGFPRTPEEPRVVRGGSWNFSQAYAHAAFRNHGAPGSRNGPLGFRLVCSSPISSNADR